MARSVVGYIKQYLNSSATASPTQAVESATGIPIATGTNSGEFQEFSDSEAATYSSKQLVALQIVTAGSGQTPGTYLVTASTGGAVASIVVAAGGTVTAIPTIVNPGKYATDTAPTFTLAAGGTPATFSATLGFLYSGVYRFIQLDPAVTGAAIPVGPPLYWLQTNAGMVVTTVGTGNYPDFAGWSIDPSFGPALPWAFIQQVGKGKLLFGASGFPAAFGNLIGLAATPGATFTDNTTTPTATTLGLALAVGTASTTALCRVNRYISRF